MPGNEVEEGIFNVYVLDNSSQNLHISQTVGGNWPILDFNRRVGKPIQIGGQPKLNPKHCTLKPLDSVKGHDVESSPMPLNQNYRQWTPKSEYLKSHTIQNPLNPNETLAGRQNFPPNQNQQGIYGGNTFYDQQILSSNAFSIFKTQHENECADSPTLTTNSERSEITEASGDRNFYRGQQQFVRDREVNPPKLQTMQQPGYNDMQVLQQHLMFKQLQEFQRQQQLGDLMQHNPLNQYSVSPRQAAGARFSPLINGMPVHDATVMLRNWMQQGASPVAPVGSNKLIFPQEHGQALHSMGLSPQQIDVFLYGTPVSNARANMSQYPHFQGIAHDSINLLGKADGEAPRSVMQSFGFGNPSLGDQNAVTELQMKSNFGQLPVQGLNSGNFPGNLQEGNVAQVNASTREFHPGQEQDMWPAIQKAKQFGSSQGLVPLDPMEAKILYNMDENIWDAFGSRPDTGAAVFGKTLENPDSNSFSGIQCGTWSALMQSAVGEASSSDTGLLDEWSGLTFQNTEQSTDNHVSNFVDSERHQASWANNNLQSASSFSSKPFPMVADSSTSSTFPFFHNPGTKVLGKLREDFINDSSHESTVNYTPQKPAVQNGEKGQQFIHSDFTLTGQMVNSQHQTSNGPQVAIDLYTGVQQEKQQNHQQMDNSNDSLKDLDIHEKGDQEQLKFFGNFSSSAMNLNEESTPNFQGTPSALEEVTCRGDNGSNASASFRRSVLPEGSNISVQTSEHMLELLHKVDQSKDKQFGSTDPSPLVAMRGTDSRDTSIAQMYLQSSSSHGFGLRLAPPSQKLAYPNSVLIPARSQQATNDLNSRQVNAEVGEKIQAWQTQSSFNTSPPSNELAQRTGWDHKSDTSGPTSLSPYVNMQGNSAVSFSPNQPETTSQLQIHPSGLPLTSQSSQVTLPGSSSRFSPLNQVPSQDTCEQMHSISASQPSPNLDGVPISHHSNLSGTSQQSKNSSRPYNVWRNVPTQRQQLSNLPSSMDAAINNMSSTSWAPHVPLDQNSTEGGYKSSEVSTSSNLRGSDHGEELTGKETQQQHVSSNILDTSSGGTSQGQEHSLFVTAENPGLLTSHAQQQHIDKVRDTDIFSQASQRNLKSISPSHNDHNYTLLQQVQAVSNSGNALDIHQAAALGEQQFHVNISRLRQPNFFPPGIAHVLGFSAEASDAPTVEAPSQAAFHSRSSQGIVGVGYHDSQTQSSSKNVSSNHTDHGQVNLDMANPWFKQCGTPKNGQTSPIFDAGLAKASSSQFSLGKLSQNLHIQSPLEQVDGIGIDGSAWPGVAAASLVASRHMPSPYILPSDVTNQVAITRPKKRKIMAIELVPWNKELKQETKRLQNLSVAEQGWAQAMNRLIEKVEDEVGMLEDLRPIHRSKRRLVLATQLVQQLLRPASASIFSADAATNYGIISYFVSRLSLGDACSFSYFSVNHCLAPMSNSNINSENPNISESYTQKILEVVNNFDDRTKLLENEFERLHKAASFANIRAELVDLERFTVINRFAKFHVRGQTDGTSTSSPMPKLNLQRHVVAIPMTQNVPEGVQCLSL